MEYSQAHSSKFLTDKYKFFLEFLSFSYDFLCLCVLCLLQLLTIMHGLRALNIEKKAEDIQKNVKKLHEHLRKHNDSMEKLRKNLYLSVKNFDECACEYSKIEKDIENI